MRPYSVHRGVLLVVCRGMRKFRILASLLLLGSCYNPIELAASTGQSNSDGTTGSSEESASSGPDGDTEGVENDSGPLDLPQAVQDAYVTPQGIRLDVPSATGVLANDLHGSKGASAIREQVLFTESGAQVTIAPDGAFQYFPVSSNWWGEDRFVYTAIDPSGYQTIGTVRIIVRPVVISLGDVATVGAGIQVDGHDGDSELFLVSIGSGRDINGDGFDDMLISLEERFTEPNLDLLEGCTFGNGPNCGRLWGILGQGMSTRESTVIHYDDKFPCVHMSCIATSNTPTGYVSVGGDINGDGFSDAILGSPLVDSGGYGRVTVFQGAARLPGPTFEILPVFGNAYGEGGTNRFGDSVAITQGFDGDGLSDLVMGSHSSQGYLAFGDTEPMSLSIEGLLQEDGTGVAFTTNSNGYTTTTVHDAGDVNGDGFSDVILGSSSTLPAGTVYIVFGDEDASNLDLTLEPRVRSLRVDGDDRVGDSIGNVVAAGGDFNGDGLSDIVISSPETGRVYVVFGKENTSSISLAAVADGSNGGVLIQGDPGGSFGHSVAILGDFNTDGFDDLLIGAPQEGVTDGITSGNAYVIFGSRDPVSLSVSTLSSEDQGFVIRGAMAEDECGFQVSGAGDVNGDSVDDIAVGCRRDAKVYILFGADYSIPARGRGTTSADTVVGTSSSEILLGGQGNDLLTSGGGADIIDGGPGDDVIVLDGGTFESIDGGPGFDSVELVGALIDLNLRTISRSRLRRISILDISGSGTNIVRGNFRDLLELVDDQRLTIIGNDDDRVVLDLRSGGFTKISTALGFDEYTNGLMSLRISSVIEDDITLF